MFGVFNAYEKQVIHDWIAGDNAHEPGSRPLSFRAQQRLASMCATDAKEAASLDCPYSGETRGPAHMDRALSANDDFDSDLRSLQRKLASAQGADDAMACIIKLMSPVHHHTDAGLMATSNFTRMLRCL